LNLFYSWCFPRTQFALWLAVDTVQSNEEWKWEGEMRRWKKNKQKRRRRSTWQKRNEEILTQQYDWSLTRQTKCWWSCWGCKVLIEWFIGINPLSSKKAVSRFNFF
jgi:hypothetical protein